MNVPPPTSADLRRLVPATVARLPGMGLAEVVPPLEVLAARLLAEMRERPVVLVGHSQSCQVVAVAARDPKVRGVVPLGPTTDPRLRSVRGLSAPEGRLVELPGAGHMTPRTHPAAVADLVRSVSREA